MTMLTVFQIMGVSAAYLGVTLVLPWLLLRRKFAAFRTSAKFMAYFMAGNFFCMNLVHPFCSFISGINFSSFCIYRTG